MGMIKKGDLYYPTEEFKNKAWLNGEKIYSEANKDPLRFWGKLAEDILWQKKWEKVFVHQPPYFQWFVGGKLNITENCLDRNLAEKKNKVALIWEPEPVQESSRTFTYQELFNEVNKFAQGLKKLGVKKGDRVGIYLPMIPETIFAMLACSRIGAVHAVIFSAFSPAALKVRLQDTEAKILITADGYYRRGKIINLKEQADAAISGEETKVEKVIVVKRANSVRNFSISNGASNKIPWNPEKDIWYDDLVKNENNFCPAEIMDSEDLLFILYTSGSTGKPKGAIHTTGGYAVQAYWTAKWIFDLKDNDIFWSTADLGWITGHTYSCYGPLLNAGTFLIFEGAPDWPTPDRWAQIIEKHKITIFYTAPTAIRMFEKYGSEILKKYQFETLRLLGSVGEPIDEAAWLWYFKEVGKEKCPIVDTWWQTETGGILISSLPGIGPFKPVFTGLPLPSIKFDVLDDDGKSCPAGKEGNLVMLSPFSPGLLRGIYKNPEKYLETYWSQYGAQIYFTSDGALINKNGLIRIVGRVDDVIKVAGHRIASGELEAIINDHKDITECAVVGVPDEIKGEALVAFVVSQVPRPQEELQKEVVELVRKEMGPIALFKQVYSVEDLPKTRSGKIMRRILKKLLMSGDLGDLSTLANPESVEKISDVIKY